MTLCQRTLKYKELQNSYLVIYVMEERYVDYLKIYKEFRMDGLSPQEAIIRTHEIMIGNV